MGCERARTSALLKRQLRLKARRGSLFGEVIAPGLYIVLFNIFVLFTPSPPDAVPAAPLPMIRPVPGLADVFTSSAVNGSTLKFLYAPSNAQTDAVMVEMRKTLAEVIGADRAANVLHATSSSAAIEAFYVKNPEAYLGGVMFNGWPGGARTSWSYTLRLSGRDVPGPGARNMHVIAGDPGGSLGGASRTGWSGWLSSGFLPVQRALDDAIVKHETGDAGSSAGLAHDALIKELPVAGDDGRPEPAWATLLSVMLPLFAIGTSTGVLLSHVVTEIERKTRDGMTVLGVTNDEYYGSWFVAHAVIQIPSILLLVLGAVFTDLFGRTNVFIAWSLLYVNLLAYGSMVLGIADCFKRRQSASQLNSVLPFLVTGAFAAVTLGSGDAFKDGEMVPVLLALTVAFPPLGFAVTWTTLRAMDNTEGGVSFSNVNDRAGGYPSALAMLMANAVGVLVWQVTSWWMHHVLPREYGVQYSPLFCCKRSYWKPTAHRPPAPRTVASASHVTVEMTSTANGAGTAAAAANTGTSRRTCGGDIRLSEEGANRHEELPPELRAPGAASLQADGLRKVFNKRDVAVNGVSLRLFEGECLALLGPNAAGKSTTIGMLVAWYQPTAGTVTFKGRNLADPGQREWLRSRMGFVPQHDYLADELTGREQAAFYATMKGVPSHEVDERVEHWLGVVGLLEDGGADRRLRTYSGGMRRKLMLAICYINDPELVLLDEPTAGMDPASRRQLWDVVQHNKAGRTVLITSHFLDECELLGDRVAIMRRGRLHCSGTALFLKHVFGVKYALKFQLGDVPTITEGVASNGGAEAKKDESEPSLNASDGNGEAPQVVGDTVGHLTQILRRHVPATELISAAADEAIYELPLDASPAFPDLFVELESAQQQDEGDMARVGQATLELATLEEVFEDIVAEDELPSGQKAAVRPRSTRRHLRSRTRKSLASITAAAASETKQGDSRSATEPRPGPMAGHGTHALPWQVKRALKSDVLTKTRASTGTSCGHVCVLMRHKRKQLLRSRMALFWVFAYPLLLLIAGLLLAGVIKAELVKGSLLPLAPELVTGATQTRVTGVAALAGAGVAASATPACGTDAARFLAEQVLANPSVASCGAATFPHEAAMDQYSIQRVQQMLRTRSVPADMPPLVGGFVWPNSTSGAGLGSAHVVFNSSIVASLPIMQAMLSAAILTNASGTGGPGTRRPIQAYSFPLPYEPYVNLATIVVPIIMGMGLVQSSTLGTFTFVEAKHGGTRASVLLMGVTRVAYMLADFLFDSLFVGTLAAVLVVLMVFFEIEPFVGGGLVAFVILVVSYIFGVVPFAYCLGLPFKSVETVGAVTPLLMIFLAVVPNTVGTILKSLPDTEQAGSILLALNSILPMANVSRGLAALFTVRTQVTRSKSISLAQAFDFHEGMGVPVVANVVCGIVYSTIFAAAMHPELVRAWCCNGVCRRCCTRKRTPFGSILHRPKSSGHHRSAAAIALLDVAAEDVERESQDVARQVDAAKANPDAPAAREGILVQDLARAFPASVAKGGDETGRRWAVQGLSLRVGLGEICQLVGGNGAGKTTTLSMVTGQLSPTQGDAWVAGSSVTGTQLTSVYKALGFCGQKDSLFGKVTCREHLQLVADIKGLSKREANEAIRDLMTALQFIEHANKDANKVSGGTQRKLSVAMALLGQPKVLVADEPTTGLDVVARHRLWSAVEAGAPVRATLWSTHDMMEASTLGTRVAVMLGGQLLAIGSPDHLRNTLVSGLQLELVCKSATAVQPLLEFLEPELGKLAVSDRVGAHVRLAVARGVRGTAEGEPLLLSRVFQVMEECRRERGLEFYSVSQNSLEAVFLELVEAFSDDSAHASSRPLEK